MYCIRLLFIHLSLLRPLSPYLPLSPLVNQSPEIAIGHSRSIDCVRDTFHKLQIYLWLCRSVPELGTIGDRPQCLNPLQCYGIDLSLQDWKNDKKIIWSSSVYFHKRCYLESSLSAIVLVFTWSRMMFVLLEGVAGRNFSMKLGGSCFLSKALIGA